MKRQPMIRREPRAQTGWNNGDLDVAMQLFSRGLVWDGDVASKESRTHLVRNGYACRWGGYQALTGRGTFAFLTSWAVWRSAWRRWRLSGRNPLVSQYGAPFDRPPHSEGESGGRAA